MVDGCNFIPRPVISYRGSRNGFAEDLLAIITTPRSIKLRGGINRGRNREGRWSPCWLLCHNGSSGGGGGGGGVCASILSYACQLNRPGKTCCKTSASSRPVGEHRGDEAGSALTENSNRENLDVGIQYLHLLLIMLNSRLPSPFLRPLPPPLFLT